MSELKPRIRHCVRVLLLDDHQRLLMFRGHEQATERPFWFPPGGEIEPGETVHEAALRELAEETGLIGAEIGDEVWHRRHMFTWRGQLIDQRERWFVANVKSFQISCSGWTAIEKEVVTGHRWWTLDELRATSDDLTPRSLGEHLTRLLRDGAPSVPVDVGV